MTIKALDVIKREGRFGGDFSDPLNAQLASLRLDTDKSIRRILRSRLSDKILSGVAAPLLPVISLPVSIPGSVTSAAVTCLPCTSRGTVASEVTSLHNYRLAVYAVERPSQTSKRNSECLMKLIQLRIMMARECSLVCSNKVQCSRAKHNVIKVVAQIYR
ncbi:hypothetical protein J6590_037376 [Homalodisca vitripennis]|nr:hypothetical protein J6590_037376 [Homalodisca vitripennis]